jgi:hypothetical protein
MLPLCALAIAGNVGLERDAVADGLQILDGTVVEDLQVAQPASLT